jgi:hypothetical protein
MHASSVELKGEGLTMMTDTDYVYRTSSGEVIVNASQQWDLYPCQYWFPWSKPFSHKAGHPIKSRPCETVVMPKEPESKGHKIDCAEETEEPDEPSVWVICHTVSRIDQENAEDM